MVAAVEASANVLFGDRILKWLRQPCQISVKA